MDNVIRKFKPSPNEKTDSVCAKMLSEIMIFFVGSMLIIRDLLLIVFRMASDYDAETSTFTLKLICCFSKSLLIKNWKQTIPPMN